MPAYDPTGEKITFTSFRDSNQEIYIMDASGADQTRLTDHPEDDAASTFMPDGRILFASTRDNPGQKEFADAYRMDPNGANVVRITTGAMMTSVPVTGQSSTNVAEVFYFYDALGRMRKMASTQGALVDEIDFGYSGPGDSFSYISRRAEIVFRAFQGAEGLYATANKLAGAWNFRQYYFDARGDTQGIATADGSVTVRATYDEYGRASASPDVRLPYQFMGKHQKFYDPALFVQGSDHRRVCQRLRVHRRGSGEPGRS